MTGLVDRMARAIRDAIVCGGTINGEHVFCDDERLSERFRCTCRDGARAALRECLTPTEEMVEAGTLADPGADDDDIRQSFRAMIRSELGE